MKLTCLDLFSGIGGFALGFERAGIETKKFCELELFAQRVLRKHWPDIPVHDDVRTLKAVASEFDIVCGGFPCQDISYAGRGKGLKGERSGLWRQFQRIIQDVRPRYVVIENVSALRTRGLEVILGALNTLGYDAEWHCIPASAVGAPHQRDRIWIIAYANSEFRRRERQGYVGADGTTRHELSRRGSNVAYAHSERRAREHPLLRKDTFRRLKGEILEVTGRGWWDVEPDVGRVANGLPNGVDRLRALGNSIVPQIAEIIGRAIVKDVG